MGGSLICGHCVIVCCMHVLCSCLVYGYCVVCAYRVYKLVSGVWILCDVWIDIDIVWWVLCRYCMVHGWYLLDIVWFLDLVWRVEILCGVWAAGGAEVWQLEDSWELAAPHWWKCSAQPAWPVQIRRSEVHRYRDKWAMGGGGLSFQ